VAAVAATEAVEEAVAAGEASLVAVEVSEVVEVAALEVVVVVAAGLAEIGRAMAEEALVVDMVVIARATLAVGINVRRDSEQARGSVRGRAGGKPETE